MFRDTVESSVSHIAIIGNPNSGKTALFNALTGLRQKVANYPGVTVEKKEGRVLLEDGREVALLDLPGAYSLTPHSPDEKIATDVLLGRLEHTPPPDTVICVVDASNLERNLYLISQILDCEIPVVIALNMVDVAEQDGIIVDANKLSDILGVRVIRTVATKGVGIRELKLAIAEKIVPSLKSRQWTVEEPLRSELEELRGLLLHHHAMSASEAFHESVHLLGSPAVLDEHRSRFAPEVLAHVQQDQDRLDALGIDRLSAIVEGRYAWIQGVCETAVKKTPRKTLSTSDKIDRILTHRIWGFVIFIVLMTLMFQGIFTWATGPMDLIGAGFNALGDLVASVMPPGDLRDLIINGAIAGVGAVVTFLPQIIFLFLYIGILEDTGYMARAAFIMDRVMSKVGLHGKSFIPMLSSFACAIPGIMATRTIESKKDRLVTILVAPLVSCSARLPIYVLMIAAFIPSKSVLGFVNLAGLTLVSMYLLGIIAALGSAWLFKKTLLKSETPAFIMELPPYKMPSLKSVLLQMWNRSTQFLKRAGTIILGVSIILWFLATYPKLDHGTPSDQLRQSFAGQAGRFIEPAIRPLGFDWKIGLGLVASVLQREVFVSTMGTIYGIKDANESSGNASLRERLQQDVDPETGSHTFTTLTAICLMIYYVLAMQCMSTVAIVRRETNGWKWPLFQIAYMTSLAYVVTLIVYHVGLLMM
ncbi:MAG TPA: ferrous iron transport protein B [Bacteroidota bacterium]